MKDLRTDCLVRLDMMNSTGELCPRSREETQILPRNSAMIYIYANTLLNVSGSGHVQKRNCLNEPLLQSIV